MKRVRGSVVVFAVGALDFEAGVGLRVVLFSQRRVALIVEGAVGQVEVAKELPDLAVVPVEDRENSHEAGPPLTGLGERLQILRPWVCPTIAHNDCLDALLID